jgi:TorA maturation chaperone TorD
MARLAEKLENAFESNDFHAATEYLSASESFIRKHLINWIPAFAEILRKARLSYLYCEAGNLLAAFLPIDLQMLEEIRKVLKSES